MKKFHIITFGCQINKSDSEKIAGLLESLNYKSVSNINEADLVVVNMCSVRQSAVDRVYGHLNNLKTLKKKNKDLRTLLTGCLLKHDFNKLKHKFDYILPIKSLPYWEQVLNKDNFFYYLKPRETKSSQELKTDYLKTQAIYGNDFSAYVPIITGCNNFCSYCVVPYTRGIEVSRPVNEIVAEVKQLIKKGIKEIWLLGSNVNHYSSKDKNSKPIKLSELLKIISKIKGDFWISLTSCNPIGFPDELIKTISASKKVSHYISLPAQSGSNEILKKMNRGHTIEQYKKLVRKIKKAIPDVFLSCDIIVGFPGETKKQFQETIKLFKEIRPDMAYIAEYSPRPGTLAFNIKDNIPYQEKQRRRECLTKTLEKIALEKNKQYIDKTLEVLISKTLKNNFLVGKTLNYRTVKVKNCSKLKSEQYIGKLIKVKITDAISWGIKGELH